MPEGLLDTIKVRLKITWEDANTNKEVESIAKEGISFLNGKAGVEIDYITDDKAVGLLVEYCRCARGGILHEYMTNYAPFLEDLRMRNGGVYGETTSL